MNKREVDLSIARVAGYHDDKGRFTRLVVESRVRKQLLDEQWRAGIAQKNNGMKCVCIECKRAAE